MQVGELVADSLLPEIANALGLPIGVKVYAGGGDAFVGLLGVGVAAVGEFGLITGSSNCFSGFVPCMNPAAPHPPSGISAPAAAAGGVFGPFVDAVVAGLSVVESGQSSTGSMLEWFKETFATDSTWEELDAEAADSSVGAGGVLVLDTFQGCRTPHADGKARGAVWGLSLATTRGDLFRALLEGIAFGTRAMVAASASVLAEHSSNNRSDDDDSAGATGAFERAMVSGGTEKSTLAFKRIAVVGGATKSNIFMQILADVIGLPLVTTGAGADACTIGAAVVATAGCTADSLAAVSKRFVQDAAVFLPDPERSADSSLFEDLVSVTGTQLTPG